MSLSYVSNEAKSSTDLLLKRLGLAGRRLGTGSLAGISHTLIQRYQLSLSDDETYIALS